MNSKVVVHINVTSNWGSTGRISEGICNILEKHGWDTFTAYGRHSNPGNTKTIKIGTKLGIYHHLVVSRLFDRQGLCSKTATKHLIKQLKFINPNIIHLHNIHGYYLNYEILFDYIRTHNIPVVWTLHDCWSFTGHCVYFDEIGCDKWINGCHNCPQLRCYPTSYLLDGSKRNWDKKKQLFSTYDNITFVPVSQWIAEYLKQSFFSQHPFQVIHNGINLDIFRPVKDAKRIIGEKYGIDTSKKMILGVASRWDARKGFNDFIRLSQTLDSSRYLCVIVGVNEKQYKMLPSNIKGIKRTENTHELATLYTAADVFVNPTYSDTYPTTNLESIACGTPVVTYRTGGSPESINPNTGRIVEKGDFEGLEYEIESLTYTDKSFGISGACREYALHHFDKEKCFEQYLKIYNQLL